MIKASIKSDITRLIVTADRMQKQKSYAIAKAMNTSLTRTKLALELELKDVFDRPTPYTMSSLFVQYATKDNLRGIVMLKDFAGKGTPAAEYLLPNIKGGLRKLKRFENALTRAGIMPTGYRAVPGGGAQMDNFGNMNRGQIVQILAYFKSFPEAGYKANMTDKRKKSLAKGSKKSQGFQYFVGKPGGRPLGIWQRIRFGSGTAVKPVIIFVTSAVYQQTFDFRYVALNTFNQHYQTEFNQEFKKAMETAR